MKQRWQTSSKRSVMIRSAMTHCAVRANTSRCWVGTTALASFNALRRTYPDDPELYYELADILLSAGYLDDCAKVCRKCLELDEDYANAYVILAMIATRRGDDEKGRSIVASSPSA